MITHPGGAVVAAPADIAPGSFRLREGVPILPASTQVIDVVDDHGTPKLDASGAQRTASVTFTGDDLQQIANTRNAMARQGRFPVLQLGHMQLANPNETHQPEPIGYAEHFRVGPLLRLDGSVSDPTPHLICDERIVADRYDESCTYPHRSPEMRVNPRRPGLTEISRIALLRREAKHEFAPVMNSRDPIPTPSNGATPTRAPEGGEVDMADELTPAADPTIAELSAKIDTIMETLGLLVDHHLAGQEDPDAPETEPEVPVQNDAAPSAQTFAPGLNSVGKPEEEIPTQNCAGATMPVQNSRASIDPAVQTELTKLRAEIARQAGIIATQAGNLELQATRIDVLDDEAGNLLVHNQRMAVTKIVDDLVANENLKLERDAEINRLAAMDPKAREADVQRMIAHYQRSATRRGFVEVGSPRAKGELMVETGDKRDEIVAYAGKHNLTFSQAKAAIAGGAV